ncbi:MAG: hypothetical protein AABN33_20450 [Acidobacteriota bacterium]
MVRLIPVMAVLLLLLACDKKSAPVARTQKDPKIAAIEERVSKTTPEGKLIIEKVLAMKPEVNEQVSTKTVGEMVDDYAKNKGAYNITTIGWEASLKKLRPAEKAGRWKVVFNYQDWQKQLLAAEWEYNSDTNQLYPFDKDNAPQFYSNEGAEPPGKKGKK